MTEYLRISDIATMLKVEPSIVEQWCQNGQLTVLLLPPPANEQRISAESFAEFLRQNTMTPGPVRQLAERLLHSLAPGTAVTPGIDDHELLVLINRPTVQRIAAGYWEDKGTWYVQLRCWPADIIAQSRAFYANVDIESFMALCQDASDGWGHWEIRPVPHISHVQRPFVYGFSMYDANTATDEEIHTYVKRYVTHWQTHQNAIRQYTRDEGGGNFAGLLAQLARIHSFTPEGEQEFQDAFLQTRRQTANFTPGLYMGCSITYHQAVALDAQGRLVDTVRARFNRAMNTWGDQLPPLIVAPSAVNAMDESL